jgi:hypothetical protein
MLNRNTVLDPYQIALREHNRRMKMPMQKGLHIASINTAKVLLMAQLSHSILLCGRWSLLISGCHAQQKLAAKS